MLLQWILFNTGSLILGCHVRRVQTYEHRRDCTRCPHRLQKSNAHLVPPAAQRQTEEIFPTWRGASPNASLSSRIQPLSSPLNVASIRRTAVPDPAQSQASGTNERLACSTAAFGQRE